MSDALNARNINAIVEAMRGERARHDETVAELRSLQGTVTSLSGELVALRSQMAALHARFCGPGPTA